MKHNTYLLVFVMATITMACHSSEAKKQKRLKTQKSTSCSGRLSGRWEFGNAPFSCMISAKIAAPLRQKYTDITFNDLAETNSERRRYMDNLHKMITESSKLYLERREPNASPDEISGWVRLNLATAHQESYWSNYRIGRDNKFRFFKGDHDHGYGMMQIDDRSHSVFIRSGKVYDLQKQMVYAMDALYSAREKSRSSPCASADLSTESINRSSYSAYNGGPGARCRWTNSQHRWSKNDRGFLKKYEAQEWNSFLPTTILAQNGREL